MRMGEQAEKWTKCYCGGWIRSVLTSHRRTPYGWVYYARKKPKWEIDNCFAKPAGWSPPKPTKLEKETQCS
jgi:hypothetical protein